METQTVKCLNCSIELNGLYCSSCGHPTKVKRINGSYLKHEIGHLLHLDKGILLKNIQLLNLVLDL